MKYVLNKLPVSNNSGDDKIVEMLLNRRAEPNQVTSVEGDTPIFAGRNNLATITLVEYFIIILLNCYY